MARPLGIWAGLVGHAQGTWCMADRWVDGTGVYGMAGARAETHAVRGLIAPSGDGKMQHMRSRQRKEKGRAGARGPHRGGIGRERARVG